MRQNIVMLRNNFCLGVGCKIDKCVRSLYVVLCHSLSQAEGVDGAWLDVVSAAQTAVEATTAAENLQLSTT